MKGFIKRFCNALKPCAGLVKAPKYKMALPLHEVQERAHASASGRIVSRGSIAMSRFPTESKDDIATRREKILRHDFASFK